MVMIMILIKMQKRKLKQNLAFKNVGLASCFEVCLTLAPIGKINVSHATYVLYMFYYFLHLVIVGLYGYKKYSNLIQSQLSVPTAPDVSICLITSYFIREGYEV